MEDFVAYTTTYLNYTAFELSRGEMEKYQQQLVREEKFYEELACYVSNEGSPSFITNNVVNHLIDQPLLLP